MTRNPLYFVIFIAIFLLLNSSVFTVDETQQGVVLQFQRIVKEVKEPGLYFKIPFIQSVEFFEGRLLEYDSAPKEIITKDKKTLVVDNYARWKISDPTKFYETVRNENGAQSRLDDVIYSDLRNELGKYDLVEIVRDKREEIMSVVTVSSNEKAQQYGIDVVDVRIKRADLPEQNERPVYDRMRAERKRQANLFRSEGEEEALKIRAETDKEKTIILSEAYKKAQQVKGEGDALAITIYADAYNRDPEFFQFMRTLEAYSVTLKTKTTLVLPPDSDFLKYLKTIK